MASRDKLIAERDDLTEAIKRLRSAIHTLNQEGRERLVAAFEVVGKHFEDLFSTLFEGGKAELSSSNPTIPSRRASSSSPSRRARSRRR